MSDDTILFFLAVAVVILCCIVCYQRFVFKKGIQEKIRSINVKLEEILDTDSDEKVMVFTDNIVLMGLEEQINRLLIDRQKTKADFKREEMSSKKMLANISHDIKTPLTVILGYLEIMRLDSAEDEMLKKVEAKAKQVMNLINQFFTLAKLESGDINMNFCRVNINEVCREKVLEFYEILQQKECEVELSIPKTDIYVWGDKEALFRILYNLLSNAIRYGMDGKYLGLFLRQDESCVYVDVVDKGKGIEREFVSNVFERLYTMEDSRNRNIQGNGLGLTIAKNLAKGLGGDLDLTSIPSVKTTFMLTLKKERNS